MQEELLKSGDLVAVYDTSNNRVVKGIVICDESQDTQILVATAIRNVLYQSYYSKDLITKI